MNASEKSTKSVNATGVRKLTDIARAVKEEKEE